MEYTLHVLNPKTGGIKNIAVGHNPEYNTLYGLYGLHRKLVAWILGESRALQSRALKNTVFSCLEQLFDELYSNVGAGQFLAHMQRF